MTWANVYRKPGADPFPPMTLLFAFAAKWQSERSGRPVGPQISQQTNAFNLYLSFATAQN